MTEIGLWWQREGGGRVRGLRHHQESARAQLCLCLSVFSEEEEARVDAEAAVAEAEAALASVEIPEVDVEVESQVGFNEELFPEEELTEQQFAEDANPPEQLLQERVAPNPNNLVYPIVSKGFTTVPSARVIVSFISLRPRLTIFVPVLNISAGKDTKLPIGNFLNSLIKLPT